MSGPTPDEAYAAALAALPGCGQRRLRGVLASATAEEVWRAVRSGRLSAVAGAAAALGPQALALSRRWKVESGAIDPTELWKSLSGQGIGVWVVGGAGYPARLIDDPDPPPILFWRGDASALDNPSVAVVGTRRCTSYGSDVARMFGRQLAEVGVGVVSGLALGIDGAAHEGALAAAGAPPVAVVGSGLDVVYPSRHGPLWRRVAEQGLLITESPLGAAPEPWRFPLRNRILAALAHVVVVVESHAAGGSMSTVRAAAERGIPVMAVPGSVRSPSSSGTNRLLADGAAPATEVDDVVTALSLEGVSLRRRDAGRALDTEAADGSWSLDSVSAEVLAAVDWTATAMEDVLRRTGLALGEASMVLTRMEAIGLVSRHGAWWQRSRA